MNYIKLFVGLMASLGIASLNITPLMAADLKSPDAVKTGLRLFLQVEDDMNRKISGKNYDRLPHENQEFQEAVGVVRQGIAQEPADFKSKVEPLLQKVSDASANVAKLSGTHDDTQLNTALKQVTEAATAVIVMFPESVRPTPGQARGPGGPPPARQ